MIKNFWNQKIRLRKYLNLKNSTLLVIEKIQEENPALSVDDVVLKLIEEKELYETTVKSLQEDYWDLNL